MKPTQFTSNMIPQTILPGKQPAGRQPLNFLINLFKAPRNQRIIQFPLQKKSCTCPYISYVFQVSHTQKNPPISYWKNGSQQQKQPNSRLPENECISRQTRPDPTWRRLKNDEKMFGKNKRKYVGGSKNGGTPKWMVKIMENPIKMDDLGVPLFSETSMLV